MKYILFILGNMAFLYGAGINGLWFTVIVTVIFLAVLKK